jgi:hypothetical protein
MLVLLYQFCLPRRTFSGSFGTGRSVRGIYNPHIGNQARSALPANWNHFHKPADFDKNSCQKSDRFQLLLVELDRMLHPAIKQILDIFLIGQILSVSRSPGDCRRSPRMPSRGIWGPVSGTTLHLYILYRARKFAGSSSFP